MKAFLLSLILCVVCGGAQGKVIEHQVQGDETAWFVSLIYFGKGDRNAEILRYNKIAASDLKPGIILKIENPIYFPEQRDFQKRLAHLKDKRAQRLNTAATAKEAPRATSEENSSGLPFSMVKDTGKSPRQKAMEELNVRASSESP